MRSKSTSAFAKTPSPANWGDALKLSLTTPPIEGRANEACIEFFANLLKLPRSSVTIASGQNSRKKIVRIEGLTTEELRKRLSVPGVLVRVEKHSVPGLAAVPNKGQACEWQA